MIDVGTYLRSAYSFQFSDICTLLIWRQSHGFAPDSVGTCQDSDGRGGSHFPPRFSKGSSNCRGSGGFGGLRFTSCLICQPLAFEAVKRDLGALHVVNAQLYPRAVAEVELRQVSVQVRFAHVLIDANQAALEDRKVALQRVDVHVVARPFELGMVNAFVFGDRRVFVVCCFVGHEPAVRVGILVVLKDRAIRTVNDLRQASTCAAPAGWSCRPVLSSDTSPSLIP
jgi:hypothetical protein